MRRFILFGFLSILSVCAMANVQVHVEPSQVSMSDTFRLTLTQDNSQNGGVPDLTLLQQDFVIVSTERHMSYTVINGQAQASSEWVISLRALKTGILTIPAIKFGLEQSNPITINVVASSNTQDVSGDASQQQDVFLLATVSEKKPYVNQQVIYTVKLFNSKRLLDVDYQGPKVENALIVPLGDSNRYQTTQNNINYVVEEQKYAIYPQKSGVLDIISPTFTALVYDINSQRIRVEDKTIKLSVQSIPAKFKGKLWLPAKQVRLSEQYENSSQILNQGGTLTRTVSIEGVAIPAQLLPTLTFEETDAFSVYPEKGADRNQVKQGELVGSTEIKVTYLFNKSGKVTIPELRLNWFNTETGQDEVAVLAPRSLDITPSATLKMNNTTPKNISQQSSESQTKAGAEGSEQNPDNWAWIIAFLFALAWVVTLGLWGWQKQKKHSGKRQYKNVLIQLNKACTESNPKKARDALLKWGSLHWPDAPLLNLTDLTKLVRDAHLKKQLNILSQVLYKSDGKTLWRGDELMRAVYAVKRSSTDSKRKTNILPPINPF